MSTPIKKHQVVVLNMKGATREPAVVRWVGKDGRGDVCAVVLFTSGALLLLSADHLTVQTSQPPTRKKKKGKKA